MRSILQRLILLVKSPKYYDFKFDIGNGKVMFMSLSDDGKVEASLFIDHREMVL